MNQQDSNATEAAHLLFQMAWADGTVQQAELDLIASFLKNLGLPLARRLPLLEECLTQTRSPQPTSADSLHRLSRVTLMELLVRVCFADLQVGPGEVALLSELALRWDISGEQLEQFRQKALEGRAYDV